MNMSAKCLSKLRPFVGNGTLGGQREGAKITQGKCDILNANKLKLPRPR